MSQEKFIFIIYRLENMEKLNNAIIKETEQFAKRYCKDELVKNGFEDPN